MPLGWSCMVCPTTTYVTVSVITYIIVVFSYKILLYVFHKSLVTVGHNFVFYTFWTVVIGNGESVTKSIFNKRMSDGRELEVICPSSIM